MHTCNFKFLMTQLSFGDGHKANGYRANYTSVGKNLYTMVSEYH